ncbi:MULTISPECIES: hypothetical protein [unclassified Bosea (in: a-proteobacteria)]|uniref:hypothetical protein n=2 Tax=Bosea TaxID=85413 RepID=UPI000F7EAFAD|nr:MULTISPECIES: hypothetical protein [unclassified Bosea (in: a-proteobacteria)]
MTPMEPPNEDTSLIDFPWVAVRFRCQFCTRSKDARLAGLAWVYGEHATLRWLLGVFRSGCAWDPSNAARKPQKYGRKCGAYLMDIGRTSPPDLPPSMSGLTLIEGGKDDSYPAEPADQTRRRRIGGD